MTKLVSESQTFVYREMLPQCCLPLGVPFGNIPTPHVVFKRDYCKVGTFVWSKTLGMSQEMEPYRELSELEYELELFVGWGHSPG